MQSTAITARKLTTGLALGLVATVAAASPALAAAPKHETVTPAKVAHVLNKGGKSKKGAKAMKRELKRLGVKRGHSPKTKRVNRSFCTITYFSTLAVAICPDNIFGWYNDVYVDYYNDYSGWLYWSWYLT
jgi:hypothetical protein